ncbi:hypothetical protein [Synechococcus sp. PCC 7502]|uniref:hypothetical protein n=1 Tax=Synechococcus sp. PCC 7502 TaxID=1173263 RepID=UPI001AEFE820|nr:hypothetical protein [Synechococcus sp. PCC 7502]
MPNLNKASAQATSAGTSVFISGLIFAFISINAEMTPTFMASQVAIIVAVSIAISIFCDGRKGLKNLFRADLVCILSLYFLSLVEFLYPQPDFNQFLTSEQTLAALKVLLIGFASLAIGRHINISKAKTPRWLDFSNIPNTVLFRLLIICAILAYFNMLSSVNFNPMRVFEALLGPRFAVPWGRGRLGDWRALISEWNILANAIPPLTGIILNNRRLFPSWQIYLVISIFVFTIFEGFASGTRNVFCSYVATFLAGYFLTLKRPTFFNVAIPIGIAGYSILFATHHMLGFRDIGILNYLASGKFNEQAQETLKVDFNLAAMGLLIDAFPKNHDFLGLELIVVFLTKPIPRVLWHDKPEGLSVSIEDVVGAEGWTVSSTYLGECYMLGGIFAVIAISLLLGMLASWWSRTVKFETSGYGIVVNALGFFTAAISMRSLIVFTTSMLPVIGLIFLAKQLPGFLGINKNVAYDPPPK